MDPTDWIRNRVLITSIWHILVQGHEPGSIPAAAAATADAASATVSLKFIKAVADSA
jgi:hypothetical protein